MSSQAMFMNSMNMLRVYGSESSDGEEDACSTVSTMPENVPSVFSEGSSKLSETFSVNAAPLVEVKESIDAVDYVDPISKVLYHNPKYEELYAPVLGPENPFKPQQYKVEKNSLAGFVEPTHINDFHFEAQRRTFTSYGYALDPSLDSNFVTGRKVVSNIGTPEDSEVTVFHKAGPKGGNKRKRMKNNDPADIDGFLGPWGGYVGEKRIMKPSEEEQEELLEILFKRRKVKKQSEYAPMEEKTILHIQDAHDYQGRSFLHIPRDLDVNLRSEYPPEKCFIPKKLIHTWTGHSKAVNAIRWFPRSAHLLLSCSVDCKIKLWEVYNERRCIRTCVGHWEAVRDICFNNAGDQFLSASYDRYVKLWDCETGQCVSRFPCRKMVYCVKFHPDDDKQRLFVAGTSDKKVVCWDTRTNEVVQEYDRHLGAVNTVTFIDENRSFISTSDDKTMRVWEWDIPVDVKCISEPTMHSIPAVTLSPNGKWLACQSMDNKIAVLSAVNRFRLKRKKTFTGHMVAGYACTLDFSPDMSYIISGDADGKVYIWNWKTTKLCAKFKAHDDVCMSVLWHPHETSKIVSAGWDKQIKLWD